MKLDKHLTNSNFKSPSLDTLKRLYEAADAYRRLTPWHWMGKNDVVAVQDPKSGRMAYCVVLGGHGLPTGFDALLNDQGLVKCREIMTNKIRPEPNEFFYNMNSLSLLLVHKEDLTPEDIALCEKVKMNKSWDGFWPLFRKFEPGYLPWHLNDEDAAYLAVCFEQVIDVARRAKVDLELLGPKDNRTFLARIPQKTKGHIVWHEEYISPEPLKRVIVIKRKVDWDYLKKIFVPAQQTDEIWEADCFLEGPHFINSQGRPQFPFCYLVVNARVGNLNHISIVKDNDHGADFLNVITETVRRFGVYPRAIYFRKQHLDSVFDALSVYNIATIVVKDLPALDYTRKTIGSVVENFVTKNTLKKNKIKSPKSQKAEDFPVYKRRRVYQFKISLHRIRPAIWREFQVESNITLKTFAQIILAVMGWDGSHLHMFYIGGRQFSLPTAGNGGNFENESNIRLHDFTMKDLMKFVFVYDFGDEWEHVITFEDVLEPQEGAQYPRCLKGARNCPPEDCGGPVGYIEFLNAIESPFLSDKEDMIEQFGENFKSEKFDLKLINKNLKEIASQEGS